MIACSGCRATLPDWAQKCQFCGSDVTKVARPKPDGPRVVAAAPSASWIFPAYYALCAYWIISGIAGIANAYHVAVTPVTLKFMGMTSTETPGFGFAFILGTVIGGLTLLVGIGLAARVEIARGIANFLAGLNILFGLLGLAGSLIGSVVAGPLGLLLSLKCVLDIATSAFMIYLIGETEKRAPSF